ncbi:MAG: lytic murein transglycosylase, partial [Pseudomonadota bacterium]|nr:lytic murein transglycosylase [Pseudomonadota bacterium]
WRAGEGVVVDAIVDDTEPAIFDSGLKPSLTVAELALAGVRPVEALMPSTVVTPLRLEEQGGLRHWLGLQNFYVITRYNHSAMYAMAIWELSQALVTERSDEYSR